MNVQELINALSKLPPEATVIVTTSWENAHEIDGYELTGNVMRIEDFSEHEETPIQPNLKEVIDDNGFIYVVIEVTD